MTTMASPRFTMRLDADLREWLDTKSESQDRSASYIATKALRDAKERDEAHAEMIREAVTEADKGVFVSEEAMTAWFEALGTENELPEPKADVFLQRT